MGKERSAIYLDSRAPILVFSGFLCHLRQTKVKCFCLVNISVIWTAAFPHRGTGGVLKMHFLKSNCTSIWWFSGEGQLQLECGPLQTHHERQAAPCKPRFGPDAPFFKKCFYGHNCLSTHSITELGSYDIYSHVFIPAAKGPLLAFISRHSLIIKWE